MTSERFRIVDDAHVYFVTYSVVEWLPVFVSETACRIVTDSLNVCHEKKGLRTNAYVIMPTHMHAILFDRSSDNERLERSLADFRKFTGRQLSDFCGATCRSASPKRCGHHRRRTGNDDSGSRAAIPRRSRVRSSGGRSWIIFTRIPVERGL